MLIRRFREADAEQISAMIIHTLKTSNSGITGTLPGQQSDWQIESGTSNGHSNLPSHQPGQKPLRVHTSNGSINVRFAG